MSVGTSPEWILRFDRTDAVVRAKLEGLLRELAVRDMVALERPPEVSGDIGTVMQALWQAISADEQSHLADDERCYEYEYVVTAEGLQPPCLEVLTRLYGSPGKGSIFYGRFVRRIGEDLYQLWIDD